MRTIEKLPVTWPAPNQVVEIGLKAPEKQFSFVFVSQFLGRRKGQSEPRLVEFSARIFLELRGERRHHIKCGMHGGKFFEDANHTPVVLECMQARPRKNVTARGGIAVLRLVHVPKQHEMDSRHFPAAPN